MPVLTILENGDYCGIAYLGIASGVKTSTRQTLFITKVA